MMKNKGGHIQIFKLVRCAQTLFLPDILCFNFYLHLFPILLVKHPEMRGSRLVGLGFFMIYKDLVVIW